MTKEQVRKQFLKILKNPDQFLTDQVRQEMAESAERELNRLFIKKEKEKGNITK